MLEVVLLLDVVLLLAVLPVEAVLELPPNRPLRPEVAEEPLLPLPESRDCTLKGDAFWLDCAPLVEPACNWARNCSRPTLLPIPCDMIMLRR